MHVLFYFRYMYVPVLLHFALDSYLIMLKNVKHGGIENHFLGLWYNSAWDVNPVSRTIGEHSTHKKIPFLINNTLFSNFYKKLNKYK